MYRTIKFGENVIIFWLHSAYFAKELKRRGTSALYKNTQLGRGRGTAGQQDNPCFRLCASMTPYATVSKCLNSLQLLSIKN